MPQSRQSRLLALLLVCSTLQLVSPVPTAAQSAAAQQPPPPAPQKQAAEKPQPGPEKPPDYAGEAFVVEQIKTSFRFEKDGTGQREMRMRAKIQSEAGVEGFGQLVFPYTSANEKLEIDYVRVHKAGGGVVTAAEGSVQDLTAPVASGSRIYTDLRQKHVTVPGLRPGDVLEYHVVWRVHTPLAPNHFWLEHYFLKEPFIVLDEQLEIDVPLDSALKLKTEPGLDAVNKEQGGRRVYTWKHANLKRQEPDKSARRKKESDEPKPPHVQMSTFKSWGEVGEWYAVLERDRSVPDEKIRAKVAELVRGREGERAKVEALYEYVAKNFRYVSLSLGQGRYQPHAAAEVLANQYGDCKDKHTLLAAMLRAAGLRAYPALIHSARKIDAEVPSPAQFDHVISAIPLGGEMLWVDTTTEVAPFRLLSRQLRDKHALLITGDAPARLETTPADPPFPVTEVLEVEGKVNELGALNGRTRLTMRGDNELLYRLIFRRTPASDWKQLGQFLAITSLTYGLDVSGIKPGDPAATDKPFEVEYDFSGASFMDWSSKKAALSLPLPSADFPDADGERQEESGPIKFGGPGEITRRLRLTLPAAYTARAPLPVTVTRDYAEYRSQYRLEGNTLVAERTLRLRVRELPASRAQDYLAFVSAARADEAQGLFVEKGVAGAPSIPDTMKVEELLQAASAAAENDDNELAAALLRRVLEKEPKHKTARRNLGHALYEQREYAEAASVLREQTRINPFDDYSYHLLGQVLWGQQNYAEAEAAFRKQLEVTPLHKRAQGSLGQLLVEWRKYKEAVPELEKALTLTPEDETLFLKLGSAYLHLGQNAKATEAFGKAVELAPGPQVWNDVAYDLAVAGVQLDKARQYAESAVTAIANELRNVEPERLTSDTLYNVTSLIAYWDTLGWVYYRRGELELAERYLTASWQAGQYSENGDHLGLILEKHGRPEEAARTYALAAFGQRPVPEPRERLEKLVGKEKAGGLLSKAKEELAELSTVRLGALLKEIKEPVAAEFFIILAPGGPSRSAKVVDVRFVDGSEKLRPLAAALKGAPFRMSFPDDTPTRLIRHGTLTCRPANAGCAFVMTHPDDVTAPD